MNNLKGFSLLALLVTVVFNGILVAALFFFAYDGLAGRGVAVLGLAAILTLAMWAILSQLAQRSLQPPVSAAPKPVPAPPPAPRLTQAPETSALQLLSLLQRKGRLIDFLNEDLRQYQDAQIGAAVRTIHQGCKSVLDEHVQIEPIMAEAEGTSVSLDPGFDAHAIQLIGHVEGTPPFNGAVRHRGWRVTEVNLPRLLDTGEQHRILVPAEVDVVQ